MAICGPAGDAFDIGDASICLFEDGEQERRVNGVTTSCTVRGDGHVPNVEDLAAVIREPNNSAGYANVDTEDAY